MPTPPMVTEWRTLRPRRRPTTMPERSTPDQAIPGLMGTTTGVELLMRGGLVTTSARLTWERAGTVPDTMAVIITTGIGVDKQSRPRNRSSVSQSPNARTLLSEYSPPVSADHGEDFVGTELSAVTVGDLPTD